MGILRNTANQTWRLLAFVRATGERATGIAATITADISKDDGAFTATATLNPTEEQNGFYQLPLSQSETNAAKLDLAPESSDLDIEVLAVPPTQYTTDPDTVFTLDDIVAALQNGGGGGIVPTFTGTNVSSPTALLTAAEFLKRADVKRVRQLCSDTDLAIEEGALAANANLAAALIDAQGLLEAACLRGGIYSAADLANLEGASKGAMLRLLARITFCLLHERKPLGGREPPWFWRDTMDTLDALANGKRLFGLQANVEAGVHGVHSDTRHIVDEVRGTTASKLSRLFGIRLNRQLP